jgi:hypothetical protein
MLMCSYIWYHTSSFKKIQLPFFSKKKKCTCMLNFAPNLRVRVGFYDIFIGEVFSNNIFFLRAFTQIPFFKEKIITRTDMSTMLEKIIPRRKEKHALSC